MRPERACECRAVVGTGRVHTACERGQRGLDISTLQKPSSFVIQPLSARLSCKLPSLISRGWRARKRAKPRARPGALGGSTPLPEEAAGPGLLHLDPSRRRTRFCLGFQGREVLFDPRPGRRWWHRARRAPAGPGGRGGARNARQLFPEQARACGRPGSHSQRPPQRRPGTAAARCPEGEASGTTWDGQKRDFPTELLRSRRPVSSHFLCFSLYSTTF